MFSLNKASFANNEALYYLQSYIIIIIIGAICSVPLKNVIIKIKEKIANAVEKESTIKKESKVKKENMVISVITSVCYVLILILCTASLVNNSFNPFLYFRF